MVYSRFAGDIVLILWPSLDGETGRAREVELQAGWTSLFAGFQCVASALGVDLGESPELDFYALYSSLHSVEKIGHLEQMIV